MLWNLIHLAYRGLSIIRWNNYPRIQNYVESEHISLKLHIAYIISSILKEKQHKVDLVYIYKYIYWSNFFTFIYSDIKYNVKHYLKQNKPLLYKKLWENLWDFFLSLDIHQNIKSDLKDIIDEHTQWDLFDKKYIFEHKILDLTKLIETRLEIEDNVQIYWLSYEDIFKDIENKVNILSKEIGFEDINSINKYLSYLIRLKFAYRWNRNKRKYDVSVLSHLFFVFMFSYFLGLLKGFDNQTMEELLTRSLLHDLAETLTGDVITPTKLAVEWFKEILEDIEKKLVKEKLSSIFDNYLFKKDFERYILYPFEWELGKIAKYSDNLSAMFEAKLESDKIHLKVYKNIKNKLWAKNDNELDYILKYGVDYFEEDVEDKWKKFIWLE